MQQSSGAVRSVTYVSTSAEPLTEDRLASLLAYSRAKNEQAGITGLLAVRGNDFFQVIEGSDAAIGELLEALHRDRRHVGMRVLSEERLPHRNFPDWSMQCERLDGYAADAIPGYRTAHGRADGDRAVMRRALHDLVSWLQRSSRPTT